MKFSMLIALVGLAAVAAPLSAQERDDRDIPKEYRPPAGMCRIWIDGVPPSQQPAPTDCASAVRNRPANGRVIFGDQKKGDRDLDKVIRRIGPARPAPKRDEEEKQGQPERERKPPLEEVLRVLGGRP